MWRLVNSGRQPIRESDFERPLELRLEGSRILQFEVSYTRPKSFAPPTLAMNHGEYLQVQSCLINPRDLVEVQMLVDGKPTSIDAEARIADVSAVETVKLPVTSWGDTWRVRPWEFALIAAPGLAMVAIGAALAQEEGSIANPIVGVAIILAGAVWYPFRVFRTFRRNSLFFGS